jgi:hypothetical protein
MDVSAQVVTGRHQPGGRTGNGSTRQQSVELEIVLEHTAPAGGVPVFWMLVEHH